MLNELDQRAIEHCAELVAELANVSYPYIKKWEALEETVYAISDRATRAGMAKYVISLLAFRSKGHWKKSQGLVHTQDYILGSYFNAQDYGIMDDQLEHIECKQAKSENSKPEVISVLSQKGGVGKSTVAIAVAAHLAKKHIVTLVDLDFGGPTLYNFLSKDEGLWLNQCFTKYEFSQRKQKLFTGSVYDSHFKNLTICPASPDWEDQMHLITNDLPYPVGAERDFCVLKELLKFLWQELGTEYVVFDTAAEMRGISRTVADLTAYLHGFVLFVASLQPTSWCTLLEHYWRMIIGTTRCALIFNRVPYQDLSILKTPDTLIEYLFTQISGDIRTFGIPHRSATLLRNMIPGSIPLIGIRESNELERVSRSGDLQKVLRALPQDYKHLYAFLETCQK